MPPTVVDSLLVEGVELAAAMAIEVVEAGDDASLFDREATKCWWLRSTRMI